MIPGGRWLNLRIRMGIHFQDGEDRAIQQRGLSAALEKECIRSLFHVRILRAIRQRRW